MVTPTTIPLGDSDVPPARRSFLKRAAAVAAGSLAVPAALGQSRPTTPAAAHGEASGTLGVPGISSSNGAGDSTLANLSILRRGISSRRLSSYDLTGGNVDRVAIPVGETVTIADIRGAGSIRHIWMTASRLEVTNLRGFVVRMYWDGEETPSVLCPIGDFFGLGHAQPNYYAAAPMSVSDRGLNMFWAMPFATGARITVENDTNQASSLYFYIDYHEYDSPKPDAGRFHANFRRTLVKESKASIAAATQPLPLAPTNDTMRATPRPRHTSDEDNFLILETEGRGHFVGCFVHLDTDQTGWWGEGDDMIVIDGEPWPPRMHGTGLEDYFCGAWCYNRIAQTYTTPYYGYSYKGNNDYTGKHSQYRFHIEDPIFFEKSIRFSIEHGHNNDRSGDWTSTAYWYQVGRTKPLPAVGTFEERLPFAYGGVERPTGLKNRDGIPR